MLLPHPTEFRKKTATSYIIKHLIADAKENETHTFPSDQSVIKCSVTHHNSTIEQTAKKLFS